MKDKEVGQIVIAVATLGIISGFREIFKSELESFAIILVFSAMIIGVNILSKKLMASRLDSDAEHEIWKMERFGFKPSWHLKEGIFAGIIIPLLASIISLGTVKFMTLMTYETRALKRRAAKRFGPYSFTEMTDYHNALVGAAGIIGCLLITFIASFFWVSGDLWNLLGKMAMFYALCNMIPISKLDGSQIFFGSRVLWAVLATITLIFLLYTMLLV